MKDLDWLVQALAGAGVQVLDVEHSGLEEAATGITLEFPNGERFAVHSHGYCDKCEDFADSHLYVRKV